MKVGFIGTRDIKSVSLDRLNKLNKELEKWVGSGNKNVLSTGAAKGIDQYCAEYGVNHGCKVNLYLPWGSYEQEWINSLSKPELISIHVLNAMMHKEAFESVCQVHPNARALKQGALKLHARNYLIVMGCSIVIAVPNWVRGEPSGGTLQGIRLCQARGISVEVI